MSRKHKELFLNRLCNMLTPRNTQKYLFLQEHFVEKPTPGSDDEQEMNSAMENEIEEKADEIDDPEADLMRMLEEEVKEGQTST